MSIITSFIVPHPPLSIKEVGNGRENQIIKTINSYKNIAKQIKEIEPETIIISTPHTKVYSDYFNVLSAPKLLGTMSSFGAPQVTFNETNDIELVEAINDLCQKNELAGGIIDNNYYELDHGTMVPLYFIKQYLNNYKIIVIGISGLSFDDHFKLGEIINQAVENLNRKAVYIASGDLSHKLQEYGPYGYIEEGKIYEDYILKLSKDANFKELFKVDPVVYEKSAQCGHRSFIIMAGAINKKKLETTFYSHEDITGVGYEILSYYIKGEDDNIDYLNDYYQDEKDRLNRYYNEADEYILLAKKTIEEFIINNRKIDIPYNTNKELLEKKAGVFVSIHKFNKLRGCIGTLFPTKNNIAEEIIENAISASTKDYRFNEIEKEEIPYLEINVDVLNKAEDVKDISELDPKKYGIIVSSGFKRGVLLPDLDTIDTVDDQIRIAKMKANINNDEEITIQKFTVERHK